jgi:hypothetical protein
MQQHSGEHRSLLHHKTDYTWLPIGPAVREHCEHVRNCCTRVSYETSTKLQEINWVLLKKMYITMGSIIKRHRARSTVENWMQRESLIEQIHFMCWSYHWQLFPFILLHHLPRPLSVLNDLHYLHQGRLLYNPFEALRILPNASWSVHGSPQFSLVLDSLFINQLVHMSPEG